MRRPGEWTRKEPLFRKVNTRARGVHHNSGGEYRHDRNTKRERDSDARTGSMGGKERRGLDYTPLFRFLLSKVGSDWSEVHREAVARLDREEPIFRIVARNEAERKDFVRIGEASWYSGLYVDGDGRLRRVNPAIGPESMKRTCDCCTHTFNGARFAG